MKLLTRREHSQAELLRKLTTAGFEESAVIDQLNALHDAGLQSDSRFSEQYIQQRAGRGFGPVRIAAELRERGIRDDVAREAFDRADHNWIELARAARAKRFGTGGPAGFKEQAKQKRFLQYRGFSMDQISSAIP